MDRYTKPHSLLFSHSLAFLVPVWSGMYWILFIEDQSVAFSYFRPVMLAASVMLAFLLSYGVSVTRAEKVLVGALALLCAVLLIPSLAATDPARALQEWLKLVIICLISILLCRALRHGPTARVFGVSLIAAAEIIGILMVAIYWKYMGLSLPTYRAARIFKGVAQNAGIPLNPMAFASIFAFICGMCLLRSTKLLWVSGFVLMVISSGLTGSRAPLAAFCASGLALLILNTLRSRSLLVRVSGGFLAAGIVVGMTVAIASSTFKQMSDITEGRWDLWSVAFQKFTERPLLGYGYLSYTDDLASRLPGDYEGFRGIARNFPGGYHSEYFTMLAEQGVVGSLAILSLFSFLFCCCWKLAFRRSLTWLNGQWALFGCLFLLIRATVEVPGLFGNADEPADFLAYIFLAIVVSRISREEDYMQLEAKCMIQPPARVLVDSHRVPVTAVSRKESDKAALAQGMNSA